MDPSGTGLGNYPEAMAAAQQALYHQEYPDIRYPGVGIWAAAELIEAAVRSGMTETAAAAIDWLTEMTRASGTSWARGVEARARALQSEGHAAERFYQEAIAHFTRCSVRTELARAHLVCGECLRRGGRNQAREHLHTAYDMLHSMGMAAFAERVRHELSATGGTPRKRTPVQRDSPDLTHQEIQVARLARDGFSNPKIGARLFISAKTVAYHLGKVFVKRDISSRKQLEDVLT
jgi:DNA-binding CsgD family transcriptional regulator